MEKITGERCIELIKEKFPEFFTYWEAYIRDFGPDQGLTIQLIPFEEYTIDRIKANDETELQRIFELVEFLLCNGDEDVQNVIATGYLEYILGQDPDNIKFSTVIKYLGEQSIGYCRAWDKFTGVRTEGLWGDNKQTDQ